MNSEHEHNPPLKPQWLFDSLEVDQDITDKALLDSAKSFPLAMASVGESLQVVKLKASEGVVRRLIGMGFVPGCQVQIVSNTGGSVIVAIGDNRIGLGIGMAQKIMCTNCTNKANG